MKIVIVDDEEKIRLGLSKLIRKESDSYDIAGVYGSGAECLEMLDAAKPDLVITDIKMPGMTGLELVRNIKQRDARIKCVILSGFGEFEYARSGIALGVSGYLLKPVDKQELYDMLANVRYAVKTVEAEKNEDYHELLAGLLLGEAPPEQAAEAVTGNDPDLWNAEAFAIAAAVSADRIPPGAEELWFRMRGVRRAKPFRMPDGSIAAILALDERNDSILPAIAARLGEGLKHELKYAVSIGLSVPLSGIDDWREGYREALEAVEYNYYSPERSPVAASEDIRFGKLHAVEPLRKKILESIELMDVEAVRSHLQALFADISAIRLKLRHLAELTDTLFYSLDREEIAAGQGDGDRIRETTDWEAALRSSGTFRSAQKLIADKLLTRLEGIRREKESQGSKKVYQVKKIIEQEYKDALELSDLARRVYLTPSYLSKVFKQETGTTVIEYIISVRINKAKELLRATQLKTYQIGEMVGYNDPAYFNRQFKKMLGVTPKEYREIVL